MSEYVQLKNIIFKGNKDGCSLAHDMFSEAEDAPVMFCLGKKDEKINHKREEELFSYLGLGSLYAKKEDYDRFY